MEKKNIIIISAVGVLVILIAAWFIFDPIGSTTEESVTENKQVEQQPVQETPKEEAIADTVKKEEVKKNRSLDSDIYIVKEGDTLQKISMEIYGDTKYWIDIFGANEQDIDWYDNIRIGLELKLPELN